MDRLPITPAECLEAGADANPISTASLIPVLRALRF